MIDKGLKILILLMLVLGWNWSKATHLVGGEITWECLGNGNYVFHLNLYRDCSGESVENSYELTVYNHPSITGIDVFLDEEVDITPDCNGISFDCANNSSNATSMYVYSSSQVSLGGVPPTEGYVFTFDDCCRNSNITNLISTGTDGMIIRSVMYPFNGDDTGACFDSSPVFNSVPTTILCVGDPSTFNYAASDVDLDSLVYSFARPIDLDPGSACMQFVPEAPCVVELPYNSGFSFGNPLPGTNLNPSNVPADIDVYNGEVSFTSYTSGRFVVLVSVKAYRCGQLIAEVVREVQLILINCANANDLPSITVDDLYSVGNVFYDTVYSGELVNFDITFEDDDFNGVTPQNITLTAQGGQFGANYINPGSGCDAPPCATLSSGLPVVSTNSVSTTFNWQTSCNHVANNGGCVLNSNTYTFLITATDDFCPAPASSNATISITVLKQPLTESTSFNCLSINGDDVEVSWDPVNDPNSSFSEYQLTYSLDSFQTQSFLYESDISQTSYTHLGIAQDIDQPILYFIDVLSGCFGTESIQTSDTISTVYLSLNVVNQSIAELTWNSPFYNDNSSSLLYYIFRDVGAGMELIDSTQNLNYSDTIRVCDANVDYYVSTNYFSCESNSNIVSGHFIDDITPSIPLMDSVSVNMTTGLSEMGWQASTDPDVIGYIIYNFNGTVWNPIDTVYGVDSTYYSYLMSNAGDVSEVFRVASLDSCDNRSPMGDEHNSIHLDISKDICNQEVLLEWDFYQGWDPIMIEILINEDSTQYESYSQLSGTDSSLVISGLSDSTHYCFTVRMWDVFGRSTSSSVVCEDIVWLGVPRFHYLSSVSTISNEEIELNLYSDSSASVMKFDVYRRRSDKDYFLFVDSIQAQNQNSYVFNDIGPYTDRFSYFYYITATDSCGNLVDTTNISKSILLSSEPLKNMSNKINFDGYESWLAGVQEYRVWRSVNGVYEAAPVYVSSSDSVLFVDDVEAFINDEGAFCYYIEAVENDGNELGLKSFSYSNEVCYNQYPKVNIPNAFSPNGDGINDSFCIISSSISPNNFHMMIYDSRGQRIAETTDLIGGWDGKSFKGNVLPTGVYVYEVIFYTEQGIETQMRGLVTLVR